MITSISSQLKYYVQLPILLFMFPEFPCYAGFINSYRWMKSKTNNYAWLCRASLHSQLLYCDSYRSSYIVCRYSYKIRYIRQLISNFNLWVDMELANGAFNAIIMLPNWSHSGGGGLSNQVGLIDLQEKIVIKSNVYNTLKIRWGYSSTFSPFPPPIWLEDHLALHHRILYAAG